MKYGPSVAITNRHRLFGGAADPVTDPTFVFGRKTLEGDGAAGMGDTTAGGFTAEPDSATITGGVDSAHWAIVDGYKLAPSAAGVAAGLPGTYALNVTYVKGGVSFPHVVTITGIDGACHVRDRAEFIAAVADAAVTSRSYRLRAGFSVYVFGQTGQSNMEGPRVYDGLGAHDAGAFQWYSTSAWPDNNVVASIAGTTGTILQQHQGTQTPGNMGMDIAFANAFLAANPDKAIVFVGAAEEASNIIEHEKGSTIYTHFVARVNTLLAENPDFIFAGINHALGENDGDAGAMVTREYSNILDVGVIDAYRADIIGANDNTPFIISNFTRLSTFLEVKAALEEAPARNTFCATVDTSGYPGTDPVHYSTAELRTLGADHYTLWAAAAAKAAAPIAYEFAPANGAAAVNPASVLAIDFHEIIAEGAGNITIKDLSTPANDRTITVPDAQVSFDGSVMLIKPTLPLSESSNIAVRIASGVVKDRFDNPYGGIADDITWAFGTGTAAAITPADFADTVEDWWDATDLATIADTGGAVDSWTSKGVRAHVLSAVSTNRPTLGAGKLIFNGTSNKIGIASPNYSNPGGAATIWLAMRSGDETVTQILMNQAGGASGRWVLVKDDVDAAVSGGTSIVVHGKYGGLKCNLTQVSATFRNEIGAGIPTEIVLEIRLNMNWTGFFLSGGSSFVAKFDAYQCVIATGCDNLERRAGMLAFLQGKMS